MYGGLIGTHQRSFIWYHSRPPMASPSSKLGVCNWATPLISGTGKATDFKFGGYVYRANPTKSPLKIWEKRERGRIQGLPKFFGYPLLSQERVKLRTSNFVGTFIGSIGTNAHKNVGNSSRWRRQVVPKIFSAPMYRAHCSIIFAIAQLSCSCIHCDPEQCIRLYALQHICNSAYMPLQYRPSVCLSHAWYSKSYC